MKKILITGAGGFVGGNLCDELLKRGYDVYGTYRSSKINNPDVKAIRCDLSEKIAIDGSFDAIIHGAAAIRNDNPSVNIDDCILSTRNLIRFAEEREIEKLIYFSSNAVYGNVDGETNIKSDIVNPGTYGMAKLLGEKLVEYSNIKSRYCVRLPRMLGKNIDFTQQWLPALSKKLLANEDILYYCPDLPYNNFMHIWDLGNFICSLIQRQKEEMHTVSVGVKDKRPIIDVINILKRELNSNSKLIEKAPPARHPCCFVTDITEAAALGYAPMTAEETLYKYCMDIITEESR